MHKQINTVTMTVRCINSVGKRQELAKQWEKDKLHSALLGETQRNIGGMEKGGPLGEYICFCGTGVDPKKREANGKRREPRAAEKKKEEGRKRKSRAESHGNGKAQTEEGERH